MSAPAKHLFDVMVNDLIKGGITENKVYKGNQHLNGIIRITPNNLVGIIIDGKKIYRFIINKNYEVSMEVRLSEHVISINTENSMKIFTSSSVILDYPLVKEVTNDYIHSSFWSMVLNERY